MTAPAPDLDLDAIYREMESNPRDPMEERIGRRKLLDALAAVTAEHDQAVAAKESAVRDGRLRLAAAERALAEQKRINASNLRVMTEQLDHARQMLADAPHEEGCMLGFHYADATVGVCDCWKAGL